MLTFILLAILLCIASTALVVRPLLRAPESTPWPALTIALCLPAAVLLAYLAASNHSWNGGRDAGVGLPPGSMEEALASLEARLDAEPDDLDGWLLLGETYAALGRFGEAGPAWQRALTLSAGENVRAQLGLAEAMLFVDPAALAAPAFRLIETALITEPDNQTALWYGGLSALIREDPALARLRWERLLAQAPADQLRVMVERELAGLPPATAPAATGVGSGVPGRVGARVSVDPALSGRVLPGASLYIAVRAEEGAAGAPPLAALRRSASSLPAEVWISDADVMLPGQSLAGLESAQLVARVSNDGDATARPGDLYGEARWSAREAGGQAIELVIDRIYTP